MMTTEEMDRALQEAFPRLVRMARGDEDLATDALPFVWFELRQEGGRLNVFALRRALYNARREGLPGQYVRGQRRDDAYRLPRASMNYSMPCHRSIDPAHQAMIREAVALVMAQPCDRMEWTLVRALLLGVDGQRVTKRFPDNTPRTKSAWWRFKCRMRQRFPSLIGF